MFTETTKELTLCIQRVRKLTLLLLIDSESVTYFPQMKYEGTLEMNLNL